MRRLGTCVALLALAAPAFAQRRPNVVLIYADDLGYGDVSSYGATALRTPNIDRLAREGLRFTDAHSAAATCTPSRYALLTGEYAWRKPGTGVLPGDAALVIDPARTTLPKLFQKAGYATGVVGKWHLGLGPKGGPDWNGRVAPGPREVGFDASFIMAATGDRVPTVYVEDGRVASLDPGDPIRVSYAERIGDWPTGRANPELLKMHPSYGHDQTIVNGISRIGYMTGGKAALWKDEDMADVFTARAVAFLEQHRERPFFLFFALHDPHVPRVPHPRFAGKTGMGPRGDAIAQADWCVGEVLGALDRLKLASDTLVLFTSDNGPVVDDGYRDDAVAKLGGHKPAGPLRGGKYSNFEAGTRVPFLVRWPARVKPGVSQALVSQVDFLASFGAWLGAAPAEPLDSEDVMPALLGASPKGRTTLVEQAGALALRDGRWKYIAPGKGRAVHPETQTELGNSPRPQLYDLASDLGETKDLAEAEPERLRRMQDTLEQIRKRSPLGENKSGTRLVLLGTRGGPRVDLEGRKNASTLLLIDGTPYLVDCGYGASRQLLAAGVPLSSLRHVFITHLHSDHNLEFGPLVYNAWAAGLKAVVHAYGPPGTQKMADAFFRSMEFDIETRIPDEGRPDIRKLVVAHDLDKPGVVVQNAEVKVTAALVNHPPIAHAYAYRFDAKDRSVVISGDTAYSPRLVELARGADVLVHEVLYLPGMEALLKRAPYASRLREHLIASHTVPEDVGKVAAEAGVKTVVLSHFVPGDDASITDEQWAEGVRRHFSGRIVVGKDLMEIH